MATFDHALPESETTKELKSFIAKQQETDVIRHVGRDLTLQGWDALGTRVEVYWSRANTFRQLHDIFVRSDDFAAQVQNTTTSKGRCLETARRLSARSGCRCFVPELW